MEVPMSECRDVGRRLVLEAGFLRKNSFWKIEQ
jgi:hypothetical protein